MPSFRSQIYMKNKYLQRNEVVTLKKKIMEITQSGQKTENQMKNMKAI